MMVTFVSECEKKALSKTRRVLDAFANRIGSRTWQTVITLEGLDAVKKLLRKTASKNTAVSCHWIRSRSRSELVWVVGNRGKFNEQGYVPVNQTQKDLIHKNWEDDWHYLPLIKSLTALAALFHDWGKSSELFQEKLNPKNRGQFKGDPLRHEWVSTVFLKAYVNGEPDEQWLKRLAQGEFDIEALKQYAVNSGNTAINKKIKLIYKLPPAACALAWLVLSHHRLPVSKDNIGKSAPTWDGLFKKVRQNWGYENHFDDEEFENNLPRCFEYPKGLPSDSAHWMTAVKKQASRLLEQLPLLNEAMENGTIRAILNHARLSLMLGDHYYSSLDHDDKTRIKHQDLDLHANTDNDGNLKQTLDEHLLGVMRQAQRTAHFLPMFEGKYGELSYAHDVNALRKKSPLAFKWQDKAVDAIAQWRNREEKLNPHHFGFFAVNMASTGKGKTFANAKIMRALSFDAKKLRYILALGLRTLTLQTGDEYRERIGLKDDELAVLIGSKAVLRLHKQKQAEQQTEAEHEFLNGSESEERLLDNEIHFDSPIPDGDLKTLLRTDKDRKFLFAPVLSCTIDHLMSATETMRGGRYILPTLRLMSSDLVIDEIDDFSGKDLIAIGRLIHLAGMLGRKVMISSATIPPDLAIGYFNAYQAGWAIFSKMRTVSPIIGCAWIDENISRIESIPCQQTATVTQQYKKFHHAFVQKRLKFLANEPVKRKAEIIPLNPNDLTDDTNKQEYYFAAIQKAIEKQHRTHCQTDDNTNKQVSFGVVRMANITPCVELTEYLLAAKWPDDIDVRVMAYHSRQVLLMRHEQEKHLDAVLKRDKNDDQKIYRNLLIRKHLDTTEKPQVIFITVASPVEEVGRDHDWDWAVIEPSSYRSIIQMAGRVLRHRNISPESPNIALLQYNLKGFMNKKPAFYRPGYETNDLALTTHDLTQLVDVVSLQNKVDAAPRIARKDTLTPDRDLADLEHESTHKLLTRYDAKGPESMQGWLDSYWWLTAVPQHCVRFRDSQPMTTLFLVPTEEGDALFEKDSRGKLTYTPCEIALKITHQESLSTEAQGRLWLYRDYRELLKKLDEEAHPEYLAAIYGELSKPTDESDYTYSSQLGLVKRRPPT